MLSHSAGLPCTCATRSLTQWLLRTQSLKGQCHQERLWARTGLPRSDPPPMAVLSAFLSDRLPVPSPFQLLGDRRERGISLGLSTHSLGLAVLPHPAWPQMPFSVHASRVRWPPPVSPLRLCCLCPCVLP